ncbi:unnamed protein product [Arctogadus glacialis]
MMKTFLETLSPEQPEPVGVRSIWDMPTGLNPVPFKVDKHGNEVTILTHVCLSVCVWTCNALCFSVCLSVCVCVWAPVCVCEW